MGGEVVDPDRFKPAIVSATGVRMASQ